jgi:hypothetical protein
MTTVTKESALERASIRWRRAAILEKRIVRGDADGGFRWRGKVAWSNKVAKADAMEWVEEMCRKGKLERTGVPE